MPLVVVDPRTAVRHRESAIVRDVDLAPTLYALTGVAPPGDLDGQSLAPAVGGAPVPPQRAYAETGLWFTEDIPGLPGEMRLPYPGIARLTEVDTQHGDELVLQKAMRPLTIVAKHRMVRDDRWKLVYVPTRTGVAMAALRHTGRSGRDAGRLGRTYRRGRHACRAICGAGCGSIRT